MIVAYQAKVQYFAFPFLFSKYKLFPALLCETALCVIVFQAFVSSLTQILMTDLGLKVRLELSEVKHELLKLKREVFCRLVARDCGEHSRVNGDAPR